MREIRGDVEKQLADRRQVFWTPYLRLWSRDVYERLRVSDGTRKPREAAQNIANTRDVRTAIVSYGVTIDVTHYANDTWYRTDHCRQ